MTVIKVKESIMKRVILYIICCICFVFQSNNALADVCKCGTKGEDGYLCSGKYHVYSHHYLKLPSGKKYGTRGCWISSDFTSDQKKKIKDAVTTWNTELKQDSAGSYITLANITDSSSATIKIKKTYMEADVQGITNFFSGTKQLTIGNEGSTLSSDYTSTVIKINEKTIDSVGIKKLTSHEIGHALGLSHRNCTLNSIMYKNSDRECNAPLQKDIRTIAHIYC